MKTLALLFVFLLGFAFIFMQGNLFEPDPAPSKSQVKTPTFKTEPVTKALNEDAEDSEPSLAVVSQTDDEFTDTAREPQHEVDFRQRVRELGDKIPTTEEVRAEVAGNSHSTPSSYIEFATAVAPLMEQALTDKIYGRELFDELENCAASNSLTPSPIKSICLQNMKRLSDAHPDELGEAFQQTRRIVTPEEEDFLRFMEM